MPDSTHGSDQPVTPDGIEFDPFEMDWPWPGMQRESDEATPPSNSAVSPTPPQIP